MTRDTEGLGGLADLAVHLTCDADRVVYVLICNNIVSTVVVTQRKNNTTYISYVDSSGYNRGFSTSFITAVLQSIPGLVVCFSYPKKEPILGNSSRNPSKNVMSPIQLFGYWCRIFDERCAICPQSNTLGRMKSSAAGIIDSCFCVTKKTRQKKASGPSSTRGDACYTCTWSNFTSLRSHPYEGLDEIEIFDDDPKSKMVSRFREINSGNMNDVFEGLLVRADFLRGGLLFSRCFTGRPQAPGQSPAEGETLAGITDPVVDCRGENQGAKGTLNIKVFKNEIEKAMLCLGNASAASSASEVSGVVKALQISDFSSEDVALRSTARFIEEFGPCLRSFRMERDAAGGGEYEEIVPKIIQRVRR